MYNLAIRKCTSSPAPSPEVENFQMKIYYPTGDRTPDPLNQRQTCYHLSQHGELYAWDWKLKLTIDALRSPRWPSISGLLVREEVEKCECTFQGTE